MPVSMVPVSCLLIAEPAVGVPGFGFMFAYER